MPGPTLADLVAEAEDASEVPAKHESFESERKDAQHEATLSDVA